MAQPSHPSASLVDFVPMIRSPATWTPPPVTLPPDIHPLPEDISAYFVYPYSLETHVLSPQPPHLSHAERIRKLEEQHAVRVKFMKDREDEKKRKKREQMRKVAPGWEPAEDEEESEGQPGKRSSSILEPTRKQVLKQAEEPGLSKVAAQPEPPKPRDPMDDLVEGLARLDELEGRKGQH